MKKWIELGKGSVKVEELKHISNTCFFFGMRSGKGK